MTPPMTKITTHATNTASSQRSPSANSSMTATVPMAGRDPTRPTSRAIRRPRGIDQPQARESTERYPGWLAVYAEEDWLRCL